MRHFLISFMSTLLVLVGLIVIVTTAGCVNKCTVALPVIEKTQTIVGDAAFALAQVQSIVDTVPMPDNIKTPLRDALAKAGAGLKAANAVLVACEDICKAPDLTTTLKDFNNAWGDIRSILTLFGRTGKGIELRSGASLAQIPVPAESLIPDPIAYGFR